MVSVETGAGMASGGIDGDAGRWVGAGSVFGARSKFGGKTERAGEAFCAGAGGLSAIFYIWKISNFKNLNFK